MQVNHKTYGFIQIVVTSKTCWNLNNIPRRALRFFSGLNIFDILQAPAVGCAWDTGVCISEIKTPFSENNPGV